MTDLARSPQPTAEPAPGDARTAVRPAYLVAGTALLAAAVTGAAMLDTGVASVLLFAVLPDVALLVGLTQPHAPGQLPRSAVPVYNALHSPAVPAVLLLATAAGLLGTYWLVAATTWAAHIALDRGLGYGLRTRDGWQRG